MALFGFTYTPPLDVFNALTHCNIAPVHDINQTYKNDILLFFSTQDFLAYSRKPSKPAFTFKHAVVFDAAHRLQNINATILDAIYDPSTYTYSSVYVNSAAYKSIKSKICKSILDSKDGKDGKKPVATPKQDLIKNLITLHTKNRFLNTYNELLYTYTAANQRDTANLNILRYLLGLIDLRALKQTLRIDAAKKRKKLYKHIKKFMLADAGHNLRAAVQYCVYAPECTDVVYSEAISKFNVTSFELKYLCKACFKLEKKLKWKTAKKSNLEK